MIAVLEVSGSLASSVGDSWTRDPLLRSALEPFGRMPSNLRWSDARLCHPGLVSSGRPSLRVSSLVSRILVSRNVCRNSLTLGYDGETVVLVDDPLDVPDEVLRHHSELPRIHPDVPVLIQRDADSGVARHACALTRDVDPVGA
jgi:hypothetical protein